MRAAFSSLIVVLLSGGSIPSLVSASVLDPPDHYLCYKASAKHQFKKLTVDLVDRFGSYQSVEIQKAERLCNPVDKNGEGITDPTAHLMCYTVKTSRQPSKASKKTKKASKKEKPADTAVEALDQFGQLELKLGSQPETLCLPAEKDGEPSELAIDHFTMYKARSTTPKFEKRSVDLVDQFGVFSSVEVKKPKEFGTPVDKNREGVIHSEAHLTCYEIKKQRVAARTVDVEDQFGQLVVNLRGEADRLCVPSTTPTYGASLFGDPVPELALASVGVLCVLVLAQLPARRRRR